MKDPGNRTTQSARPEDLDQEGFCKNAILPELLLQIRRPGASVVISDDLHWRWLC